MNTPCHTVFTDSYVMPGQITWPELVPLAVQRHPHYPRCWLPRNLWKFAGGGWWEQTWKVWEVISRASDPRVSDLTHVSCWPHPAHHFRVGNLSIGALLAWCIYRSQAAVSATTSIYVYHWLNNIQEILPSECTPYIWLGSMAWDKGSMKMSHVYVGHI